MFSSRKAQWGTRKRYTYHEGHCFELRILVI
jgi:hypothetical protein